MKMNSTIILIRNILILIEPLLLKVKILVKLLGYEMRNVVSVLREI